MQSSGGRFRWLNVAIIKMQWSIELKRNNYSQFDQLEGPSAIYRPMTQLPSPRRTKKVSQRKRRAGKKS